MDTLHGSTTEEDACPQARRPPRRRLAVAAVLLVILAAVAFGWWGRPRLGPGSMTAPGAGVTLANDGIEDTRMVVRGRPVDTASVKFSISNDGHLPLTLHGLDVADSLDWISTQRVTFAPGIPGGDEDVTPSRQVTLRPGEEATVFWSLDLACHPSAMSGTTMTIEAMPFRVTWFGIPSRHEVPLRLPITFTDGDDASDRSPASTCADV